MGKYVVGNYYTRTEIRKIENDPGNMGKWIRGYVEHKGEMFIFSTYGGEAYTGVDHGDKWIDGNTYYWNGTKKSNIQNKYIKTMLNPNCKIHLFTKKSKKNKEDLKGSPFRYEGTVIPWEVSGKDPINIIWKINKLSMNFIELDDLIYDDEIVNFKNEKFGIEDTFRYKEKERYKRSNKLRDQALKVYDFTCEINPDHKTFISKFNNKNYVEIHHIIPISAQIYYKYKLDCIANIACLCPNCHRQLHYGTWKEKKYLLEKIFRNHKEQLKEARLIKTSFKEIANYYK
ncbi:hypothetical protein K5E_23920 [Enterococcus thailandicus]|uniref:HNH endonuclease n=1 Tax=Enterococcus thailandicus TaxID=417368 RepID=UPI00244D7D5A|nr:HNH endonuclease [Enterococcus thailandicus]GMC10253.1 hypothetical protein K5E_23920 [Enterococcus thailandicus]